MYDGYKIYGPYGKRRKVICLVSTERRTTMAYARYLMSLKLGRPLAEDEEVDHLDDDCTNDDIKNLQILTPEENRAKQARLRREQALVTLVCPECNTEFTRFRRYTNLRSNGSESPSCCSRSCSAKFHNRGRAVRSGGIGPTAGS